MSVHLLIIASIVQGISPDQHHLVSLRGVEILFSSQDFSNSPGDEADSPGEAGVLTEPENEQVSRLEGCIKDPPELIVQGIGFDLLRFRCPQGNLLTPDRLSILLCRLTC